jgi:hypothetical protein
MKDKPYYDNSDGGLTLSGGEPLWQSDFCLELMTAAKALGLHICVETCGYLPLDMIEKSAALKLSDGLEYGECGRYFLRMNLAAPRATVTEGLSRLKKAIDIVKSNS